MDIGVAGDIFWPRHHKLPQNLPEVEHIESPILQIDVDYGTDHVEVDEFVENSILPPGSRLSLDTSLSILATRSAVLNVGCNPGAGGSMTATSVAAMLAA